MRPTEILQHEHRTIERVLSVLEQACRRLESGQNVAPEVFADAVDFVRNFADRCHHAKEENELFVRMGERGLPKQSGPVGMMLWEHDQARDYIRALAAATDRLQSGDREARRDLVANGIGYAELMRQHIMKEDNILYPLANQLFSDEDQEDLQRRFDAQEARLGEGLHEHYEALVESLEERVGIAPDAHPTAHAHDCC